MTIWYVLEVSATKPTVFRVSVVRNMNDADDVNAVGEGFNLIGVFEDADKLTAALEPYLRMEENT